MLENVIKKLFPIRDEDGNSCTFPTFASQVFFDDGSVLEGKQFGGGGVSTVDPLTIYPVGSIYMSVNEASPASLFGGTWERIEDTFLLASGNTYAAGDTGGAQSHEHSLENAYAMVRGNIENGDLGFELKEVGQTIYYTSYIDANKGANGSYSATSATRIRGTTDISTNMPPYLAVYMWKRVS